MPNKRRAATIWRTRKQRRDQPRTPTQPRLEIFYGPAPGPGIVQASMEEVVAALTAHADDLEWPSIVEDVLPVIPRVRPYPTGMPDAFRTLVPPGIVVGFGIDIGPAFMNVTHDLLAGWGISEGDLTAAAIANVHRRAASVDRSAIYRGESGEWLQTGVSIGSTLVLAPTELCRIFEGPRFFITPMRDLIIGLPSEVDRAEALWLYREIADLDPNCLGPTGYLFDGVAIVPEPLVAAGPKQPLMRGDASAFVA